MPGIFEESMWDTSRVKREEDEAAIDWNATSLRLDLLQLRPKLLQTETQDDLYPENEKCDIQVADKTFLDFFVLIYLFIH